MLKCNYSMLCLMGGFGVYLLRGFNEVDEVLRRCVGCGSFVVIEPPRGVNELSGWLAIRQHDSIEEAVEELLNCIVSENEECKCLGSALKPWVPRTVKTLGKVLEEVGDVDGAV
jgi:hypothetical protein